MTIWPACVSIESVAYVKSIRVEEENVLTGVWCSQDSGNLHSQVLCARFEDVFGHIRKCDESKNIDGSCGGNSYKSMYALTLC